MLPRRLTVVVLLSVTVAGVAGPPGGTAASRDHVRPYAANPRYWQYKGKPVLMLGGSKTDHIFLLDDLREHLDEIVKAGGNTVRNTMSQREGVDLKPHKRAPNGTFDLRQWNEEYWRRFTNLLRWCDQRDIIIQIEVWDRFDFSGKHWLISPWNPKNNVNYTVAASGLAEAYPAHPWKDRQPFFHTVPGMKQYRKRLDLVRGFQVRFVTRMLDESLKYANVLYCMNNETSTDPAWGQYWMKFIRAKAAKAGRPVYATDMFDDAWNPEKSAKLKQAIASPRVYPFLDVSQVNSRNFNQDHWDRFIWIVRQTEKRPRPLNHTKIYSDGNFSFGTGTPKDGVERFWRNLIGGAASCRFHRPPAGIGLNDVAKACIQSARKIESLVPLWHVRPAMGLLRDRSTDEAYLAADPGRKYVLYFTDGGAVGLDLRKTSPAYRLRWVNIATGQWQGRDTIRGGRVVKISAPGKGAWVAAILGAAPK